MILNINYFFILFFFFFSVFLSSILVILTFFFFTKKKTKNIRRKSLYECGFESFGDSHVLINIQFITVALLFVIFDLEILFLLP
jgi:NADH-quinone oxidoreductase subunit A